MAQLSPLLAVADVARSMDYYEKVLHFRRGQTVPGEGGGLAHGEVHFADGVNIMFSPPEPQRPPGRGGVLLYLNVGDEDIDAYYERLKRAGAKFVEEIEDKWWGDRAFTVEDPDGYVLTFAKHVRDVDFSQGPPPGHAET